MHVIPFAYLKGIRNVHFTKIFLSPKLKTSNDENKSYRKRKHHSIPSELFDDDENIYNYTTTDSVFVVCVRTGALFLHSPKRGNSEFKYE